MPPCEQNRFRKLVVAPWIRLRPSALSYEVDFLEDSCLRALRKFVVELRPRLGANAHLVQDGRSRRVEWRKRSSWETFQASIEGGNLAWRLSVRHVTNHEWLEP